MNRDDFISIDAIRFGWNGLKNNLRFFSIIAIIVAVLYSFPSLIATYLFGFQIPEEIHSTEELQMFLPLIFISMILYLTVELGLVKIALNFRDNKIVEYEDLFRCYQLMIKYAVATMIFYFMIILPFLPTVAASTLVNQETTNTIVFFIAYIISLLAAIGLYLKFQFYDYSIVDRGLGPIEALKQSGRLTKGVLKNLLIFRVELGLAIGVAVAIASIFVEIPFVLIFGLLSKDFAAFNDIENLVNLATKLLITVPISKLATADVYRRLERRSTADNS